jgi:hypothetical protein
MPAVRTIGLDGILQLIDDAEGRADAVQVAPLGLPPAPHSRDADASALAVWDFDHHEVVLAVRPADPTASAVVLEVRPTP